MQPPGKLGWANQSTLDYRCTSRHSPLLSGVPLVLVLRLLSFSPPRHRFSHHGGRDVVVSLVEKVL